MKANVGGLDRILRIGAGVVAAVAGYMLGGTISYVLYVVAALMLVTGALGWCGLYALLGFSTCKVRNSASS